jgi:DNA repair protein RadC
MLHVARAEALQGPIISSSAALLRYLQLDMAREPFERFRVLYLDAQNRLLYETVADGSIRQAPVYPREVMRRALQVGATALILVHNHPSGDPAPSRGDIDVTRRIIDAGRELDVVVHDHIVVARAGSASFRALGLL